MLVYHQSARHQQHQQDTTRTTGGNNQELKQARHQSRLILNSDAKNEYERVFQSSRTRTFFASVVRVEEAAPPAFNIEAELPPASMMMMPRSNIVRDGQQTFMI